MRIAHETAKKARRGRPVLYSLGALLGVLGAAFGLWWHSLDVTPAIAIPTPQLPSPNAFDLYQEAAGLEVAVNSVDDATSNLKGKTGKTRGRPFTAAEREALIRQNAPALAKLRAAQRFPYLEPPVRSYQQDTRYYSGFRNLARLLRLEAQVRAARGDWSGSLACCLDAIEMGEQTLRGTPIRGRLVSAAVEAIGRTDTWATVDHLSV